MSEGEDAPLATPATDMLVKKLRAAPALGDMCSTTIHSGARDALLAELSALRARADRAAPACRPDPASTPAELGDALLSWQDGREAHARVFPDAAALEAVAAKHPPAPPVDLGGGVEIWEWFIVAGFAVMAAVATAGLVAMAASKWLS